MSPRGGEFPTLESIANNPVEKPTSEGLSPARVAEVLAMKEPAMDKFNLKVLLAIHKIRDNMEQIFADGEEPFKVETPQETAFIEAMHNVEEATGLSTISDGGPEVQDKIKQKILPHFRMQHLSQTTDAQEKLQEQRVAHDQVETYESLAKLCAAVVTTSEDMLISNGEKSLAERFNPALDEQALIDRASEIHQEIKNLAEATTIYEALADKQQDIASVQGIEHFQQGQRTLPKSDMEALYTANRGTGNDPIGAR